MNRRGFFNKIGRGFAAATAASLLNLNTVFASLAERREQERFAEIIKEHTDRFVVPEMARKIFKRSLWLDIVKRGEWKKGMDSSLNVIFYDRNTPNEPDPSWISIEPRDLLVKR